MRRLAVLLVAALCFAQQADYRLTPRFAQRLEIEDLLDRADAAKDDWVGEQDFEAIHSQLDELGSLVRTGKRSLPALDALAARFERLSLAEFKIVSSERASAAEAEARLGIRVELAGRTPDHKLLSLIGHWDTTWTQSAGRWILARLEPGPMRESRADSFFFTDITASALGRNPSYRDQLAKGIDHWRMVLDEATGIDVYGHNGIAVGDYDGDGLEDLYVCQPSGLPNRLYHNNGDGSFIDVTAAAGLDILDGTRVALFADVDNDGDQDLVVITATQPLLFRNDGKGHFTFDPKSGLTIPGDRTAGLTSAALADYDNDGYLDLYVCSYDFWTPGAKYNMPTPYYDARNGPPNFLFHNRGDGTFEDVTRKSGMMQNNNRFGFAAAWGDYDNDGYPDLYVANDFGRKNLYHNNRDGTFTDVAARAGVEDPGAGMSAAWGDYDNDGRLDLYAGNMWSSAGQRVTHNPQFRVIAPDDPLRRVFQRHARGNTLYHNNGDGTFSDVTLEAGVEMGRWAWSSDFLDIDNDGRDDLFVQNGYITGEDSRDL